MLQVAESGYRRLAPGQSVGLKHAGYVISLIRTEKVANFAQYMMMGPDKPAISATEPLFQTCYIALQGVYRPNHT